MFGFEHSLEAYVPKHKRVHGYFTMPLLAGGRLAGRVDPAREGRTLVARKVSLERAAAAEPMAQALREAASWVGCDDVRLEQIEPAQYAPRLAAALASELRRPPSEPTGRGPPRLCLRSRRATKERRAESAAQEGGAEAESGPGASGKD